MKTAICFSGELRSIDKTIENLEKYLLSRFSDADLFFFTWSDDKDLVKMKHLVNHRFFKECGIEHRFDFDTDFYFPNKPVATDYQSIIRQFYCLQKVDNLMHVYAEKHDVQYDAVVRVRPDLLITDGNLPFDLEGMDLNKLHIMDHDSWHGYCDRLYISNNAKMHVLSNRIGRLRRYSINGGSQQYEGFLQYVADMHDYATEYLNFKTCLLRNDGERVGELISIEKGIIERRPDGLFHLEGQNYI